MKPHKDSPSMPRVSADTSCPSMASAVPLAESARAPSMESLHSYLQSEQEHPYVARRGTSSFVLVHNKLSWRPSPLIMTILVDFFPNATPWAYGVSTPGARLFTEHSKQGLTLDGYGVQARRTYHWVPSRTAEDTKAFHGSSGAVAEDDRVEQPSRGLRSQDSAQVYPVEMGSGFPAFSQSSSHATTHTYPPAGFVAEETIPSYRFSSRREAARRSPAAHTHHDVLYECRMARPELSLCASVTCTTRDSLQQALLGSWWLSRYFGISLTLEGVKQEGLAVFKELQERLFIKELRLIHGVFSESWLQAISTCSELIALTAQECTAESADIPLQYVNPILSKQSGESTHSPPPAAYATASQTTSNWYMSGSRSLGLLLKLKCLHLVRSPVTEGFMDHLACCPALECCVLHRVKRIKSLRAMASLKMLRSLVIIGSTITTEGAAPIRDCPSLCHLTMEGCQFVDDYGFVAGLHRTLGELNLSHNWLTDTHLDCILACKGLRELHIRAQKSVTDVSALRQLDHLQVLDVSENLITTDGVLHLDNKSPLRRLAMQSLRCVRTWRRVFENVQNAAALFSVTLAGNDHVEDDYFATLRVCAELRVLDLSQCTRLVSLDFLDEMSHALRWLDLSGTAVTDASLAPVATCHWLRLLNLSDCAGVTRLPFVSVMHTMEFLYLARTAMTDVAVEPICVFCPKLRLFDLQGCLLLRRLGGLSRLRYLRELDLSHTRIRNNALYQLHGCRSLELINVSNCTRLTRLVELDGVRSLKWIRADSLGSAGASSPMNLSPNTMALGASSAPRSPRAASLSSLTPHHSSLSMVLELSLRRGAWTDLSLSLMLTSTSSLVVLNISECSELRVLAGLEQLAASLMQLKVRNTKITNAAVVAISACTRLEVLDLCECTELTSLNPLGGLARLIELDASDTQVTNAGLLGLATCQKLRVLSLSKCRYLSDINVLGALPRLVELQADSTAVTYEGSRQLVRCVSLKRVCFARCTNLVNCALLGSGAPKQLEVLDIYGTSIPTRGVGQPQQHACAVM